MINENELLKVLHEEEKIKYAVFTNLEEKIYKKDLDILEQQTLIKEIDKLKKKFNTISVDTLKVVATIKIKTKRLETLLDDKEYEKHVYNNVYDMRKVGEHVLKQVIKSWIKDVKRITNNNSLHLCFDTESCETKESFDKTVAFTNKHFPGFDFNNPVWNRLREFNEHMHKENFVREVRVYSWALGSVGSAKQIHGETLEQFEQILHLIFSMVKPNDLKDTDKTLIAKSKSVKMEVHNLKWDIEFLKYYWVYNRVLHWHCKTTIDTDKSFTTLDYKNEKMVSVKHIIYKELLSRQPDNTFSVVIGKNQMYECKWQLEKTEEYFKTKEGLKLIPVRRLVHFFDMYKKIPKSLKEVSKILVIDKHFKKAENYDYTKIRLEGEFLEESEVQYQYNDVYVMVKYLEQVYYIRIMKGTTASSIAFNQLLDLKYKEEKGNKYTKGFLNHYPTMLHNGTTNIIRTMYRNSYDGGFTSGVKQYEGKVFDGIILGLDINSAYPFQMKEGKLPYGKPVHGYGKFDPNDPVNEGYDIVFQRVHFDAFERKGPGVNSKGEGYGFIQLNKSLSKLNHDKTFTIDNLHYTTRERPYTNLNDDLIPQLKNFECYWSLDTLNFMLETHNFYTYERVPFMKGKTNKYDIKSNNYRFTSDKKMEGLEYVDYICFKSEVGYFGEFIDHNMFLKQIGKLLDNDCLTHVAKNGLNACSGKMGSSYIRENVELIERGTGLLGYAKPLNNTREYHVSKEYYVPYISFITDYTRLKLMKIIYQLESKFGFDSTVFQGCDTDSLYIKIPYSADLNTVQKMLDFLKDLGIEIDPIKLGAWDLEKIIFKYKNLGSKKMMMDYVKGNDIDLNMDCMELMKIYNKGLLEFKRKVTCAGLPDDTRTIIEQKGFDFFSKEIDYIKKVKDKSLGGYMLNYDVHKITDNLFN